MDEVVAPEDKKIEAGLDPNIYGKQEVKPELSPSEKASYEFAVSIKPFKKSLHSMGKKELVRILSWLVEHPLQDDNFKFKTSKEQNLANLAFYLLTRKLVIVRDGLQDSPGSENKPDSQESEIKEK